LEKPTFEERAKVRRKCVLWVGLSEGWANRARRPADDCSSDPRHHPRIIHEGAHQEPLRVSLQLPPHREKQVALRTRNRSGGEGYPSRAAISDAGAGEVDKGRSTSIFAVTASLALAALPTPASRARAVPASAVPTSPVRAAGASFFPRRVPCGQSTTNLAELRSLGVRELRPDPSIGLPVWFSAARYSFRNNSSWSTVPSQDT
jgi:hypothetical protein